MLPFVFGLIGFVEPCSMGINIMFLSSIDRTNPAGRSKEIAVFMLVRALVLALLGLSASFVGSKLFSFERGFFVLLALIYISIGFLMIFSKSLLEKLRNVRIAHWLGLDFKEGANEAPRSRTARYQFYPLTLTLSPGRGKFRLPRSRAARNSLD